MKLFPKLGIFTLLAGLAFSPLVATAATHWQKIDNSYAVTAGEALTIGQTAYIKDSDGKAYKADADGSSTYPVAGVVEYTVSSGASVLIVTRGLLGGQSALTENAPVFISATAGGLTQTATPAYPQAIGNAISITQIDINVTPYTAKSGAVTATSVTLDSGIYSGLQVINNSTVNFVYNDDFVGVTPLDVTHTYTLTTVEAGAGNATETQNNGPTGTLLITNDAADNDYDSAQTGEVILLTTGKDTWFAARFKLSDATQSDAILGLCITDTTPLAATDYLYFIKDDGDTNWDFVSSKNTTETEVAAVATADTSWHLFEIYCDGVTSCTPYIDGTAGTAISTNLCDDEELAVTLLIQNGEAVAKTMEIDYITAITER